MNVEKEIQELIDKLEPYTETDSNNNELRYLDALLEFADWRINYSENSGLVESICKELADQYECYSINYDIVEKEYTRTIKYTTLVPKELSE
jgi:hypothetical protein